MSQEDRRLGLMHMLSGMRNKEVDAVQTDDEAKKMKSILTGSGRAQRIDATAQTRREDVVERTKRRDEERQLEGDSSSMNKLVIELGAIGEAIDLRVSETQAEIDGYSDGSKKLAEVADALSVFGLTHGEGLGLSLGKETLAGKAAEEIALTALLRVIEADINIDIAENDDDVIDDEVLAILDANQEVWDKLTVHNKLNIQRKLKNSLLSALAKWNIPKRSWDGIVRRVDNMTPEDSIADTYDHLRSALKDPGIRERRGRVTKEKKIVDAISQELREQIGSTRDLLKIGIDQISVAREALQLMPEGALKKHFTALVTEADALMKQAFSEGEDQGTTIENDKAVLDLIELVSDKLSIFRAIKRFDLKHLGLLALLEVPDFAADLRVMIPRMEKISKLGRVTLAAPEKPLRQVVDRLRLDRGRNMVLETGNEGTLRGVRTRVEVFTQRAEEVSMLMDQLVGKDVTNPEDLRVLEDLRLAAPFLKKVERIAQEGNLSALGISDQIEASEQESLIELCKQLAENAKSFEEKEIRAKGQEALLKLALDDIQKTFGVDEDQARKLLTEEGVAEWFRRNEEQDTARGIMGLHQRFVRRLRRDFTESRFSLGKGLIKRTSPGEIFGLTIVAGEGEGGEKIVLSKTGEQYADALGRFDAASESGEVVGDSDTLKKDIALLRSLRLKLRAGKGFEKVRNLLTRGEFFSGAALKRVEQIRSGVEQGIVTATEALITALLITAVKVGGEALGDYVNTTFDAQVEQIRASLDGLRETISTKTAELQDTISENATRVANWSRDAATYGNAAPGMEQSMLETNASNLAGAETALANANDALRSANVDLSTARGIAQFGENLANMGYASIVTALGMGVAAAEGSVRHLKLATRVSNLRLGERVRGWTTGLRDRFSSPAEVPEESAEDEDQQGQE